MEQEIQVTQADIDAPGNPIANAVKRTFNAYDACAGTQYCIYVPKRRQDDVVLVLTPEAQAASASFREGEKIEPFSFPVMTI